MHPKITPEHLGRGAVVYIRQSTMGQVAEHTESQRRQYALAESAGSLGFASITVIDDDLARLHVGGDVVQDLLPEAAGPKEVAQIPDGNGGSHDQTRVARLLERIGRVGGPQLPHRQEPRHGAHREGE